MSALRLDLNVPTFQRDLFGLEKAERHAVLNTLARLYTLDWDTLSRASGLNWEKVHSRTGPNGETLYTLCVSQKNRLLCTRTGDTLHLISIHPDHDSAHGR
ncbi:hypothetical protein V3W47_14275 [Deinococcus sp. YIM 134068]|uniref:hypothetical protein n=1 Tax=Deinococcus lichenicola TaxID=3118910 RepID=UPI002F91EE87